MGAGVALKGMRLTCELREALGHRVLAASHSPTGNNMAAIRRVALPPGAGTIQLSASRS